MKFFYHPIMNYLHISLRLQLSILCLTELKKFSLKINSFPFILDTKPLIRGISHSIVLDSSNENKFQNQLKTKPCALFNIIRMAHII